jgi:hypothetical protein
LNQRNTVLNENPTNAAQYLKSPLFWWMKKKGNQGLRKKGAAEDMQGSI